MTLNMNLTTNLNRSTSDDLSDAINECRAFFFAGAGISFDSGGYSPLDVLSRTALNVFPTGKYATYVQKIVRNLQPELFYENIVAVCADESWLNIWDILSDDYIRRMGARLRPNQGHMSIVKYCSQAGLPLFTTNFDQLFEAAARQQGLKEGSDFIVVLPGSREEENACESLARGHDASSVLYIFKLHGCASMPESIRSTMHSITATNTRAMALLEHLTQAYSLVIAGYSGRDFDIFPNIAGFQNKQKVYWFSHRPGSVPTELSNLVSAAVVEENPGDWLANLVGCAYDRKAGQFKARAGEILEAKASEISASTIYSINEKLFLLGSALFLVGDNSAANDVFSACDWNDGSYASTVSAIYYSKALDSQGKYLTAERVCQDALERLAANEPNDKKFQSTYVYVQLYSQLIFVNKMLAGPIIYYRNANVDNRLSMMTTIRITRIYFFSERRLSSLLVRKRPSEANEAYLKAIHAIINHKIIILSLVLEAVERLRLLGLFRWGLLRWLNILEREAKRVGDYFSIANISKYRHKLDITMEELDPIRLYKMITNPLNESLYWRDVATKFLMKGDRVEAKCAFELADVRAQDCGSFPTELKSLAGLLSVSNSGDKSAILSRLRIIKAEIEGEEYRRYTTRLIKHLEQRGHKS